MELMNRDFDDFFGNFITNRMDNNMKCDIYEKDNKYFIEMNAAGLEKKDIDLSLKDGFLTIKVEKKSNIEDKDKKYIRKERSYVKSERSFNLGNVKEDQIDASLKDGVLNIIIPKSEENTRSIEIH